MYVLFSKNVYVNSIVHSLDMFHYWFAYAYMSKTSAHIYTISLPELETATIHRVAFVRPFFLSYLHIPR